MRRSWLLTGSFAFFVIAPGTLAGWIPYVITNWRVQPSLAGIPGRIIGGLLLTAGAAVLADSFRRFVFEGRGTPAPVAPPKELVVSGLYRYVRNPMYVAVVSAIVGQALLFGSINLLAYAAIVWLTFHSFIKFYEEPTLRKKFGDSYDVYWAHVPRWWPRVTPWPRVVDRRKPTVVSRQSGDQ
jgi:protein-S-isoprenylcysteine O-methyltransferase Ste14